MLQDWFSAIQFTGLPGTDVARTAGLDARFDSTGNEALRDAISRWGDEWKAIKQCRASAEGQVGRAKSIPTETRPRFIVGGSAVRYRFTFVRTPVLTDGLSDARL